MKQAVSCIVIHNNQVLIGKKIIKEGHYVSGGWHIPGGHLLEGEDEISACKREFMEETNLEIEVIEKLTSAYHPQDDIQVHYYIAKPLTLDLIPRDDITEAKFVDIDKVLESCDTRATERWPKEVMEYFSKH